MSYSALYGLMPVLIVALLCTRSKKRGVRWAGWFAFLAVALVMVVQAGYFAGQGDWRFVVFMAFAAVVTAVVTAVVQGVGWAYREWWYWRIQRDIEARRG